MIVTSKCPYCKQVISIGRTSNGFGSPICTCPSCRKSIRMANQNEWVLMDNGGKLLVIFRWLFNSIMYSLLFFAILAFGSGGIEYLLTKSTEMKFANENWQILLPIGLLLSMLFHAFRLFAEIKASKIRCPKADGK